MSKILGIDYGAKRIGIAVSDPSETIAVALEVAPNEGIAAAAKKITGTVERENASEVVIGLPLNMDGSRGPKAEEVIAFKEMLEKHVDVPVTLWDERLSTIKAERSMLAGDLSRRKRQKRIDKVAAQLILQGYLDRKGKNVTPNNNRG